MLAMQYEYFRPDLRMARILIDALERWKGAAQAQQFAVKSQQFAMGGLPTKLPVQEACCESGFRLRIRRFALPAKGGKFLSTSVAHGFNKVVIGMTGEVLEGSGLSIFLTHKKQRHGRGEKKQSSGNFQSFEGDELRQSPAQL